MDFVSIKMSNYLWTALYLARQIVGLCQPVQGLTCQEFLGDLTLEISVVSAMLGYGFHPWKARQLRSIPNQ